MAKVCVLTLLAFLQNSVSVQSFNMDNISDLYMFIWPLVWKTIRVQKEQEKQNRVQWSVEEGSCGTQGKLGGCTVISCDVTANYTTYYLSLGARQGPWGHNTVDLQWMWEMKWKRKIIRSLKSYCSMPKKNFTNLIFHMLNRLDKSMSFKVCMEKGFKWSVCKECWKSRIRGVKATQTDTYRYKLVQTVITSSDLRVCVSRQVSSRGKAMSKVVRRLLSFHYKKSSKSF